MAADNTVELIFKARTKDAHSNVRKLSKDLKGIGKNAEKTSRKASRGFSRTTSSVASFAGKLAIGAGALVTLQQGVSRAIDKGTEFESKLADLEAITGITGDRLETLADQSLELSKKYGTSAADIVEANKLVASQLAEKIDFNTDEGLRELQKVSEEAITLKTAAGIQLSDAVETTTSVINQFNLAASESNRVINTLAAGSKYGAAEVPAIGRALVNAGAAAKSAGQSIETTNAAIQVLAANGQVGERAGTALRAIFTRLKTKSQALAEAGIKNVDVEANGLVKTLNQLKPLLEDTAAAKKIFGEEALNQIQILIREADAVGSLEEKVTGTQTAYEQAEVNLNTFETATGRLSATIDSALIPAFTETAGLTVKLVNATSSLIENFAGGIKVINSWFDAHSELRREMDLQESASRSQIQNMKELRKELAEYAEQGNLTAAQEEELRQSFESTQEALKNRRNDISGDTIALKQQREEVKLQIEALENLRAERQEEFGLGLSAEDNIELKQLQKELESLNLEISSNQEQLEQYNQALEEGAMGFDEYIKKIRQMKDAQSEDETGDESKEVAGLTKQIKDLKKEYENIINQPNISDEDIFRAEGLVKQWQELEEQLEDVRQLTSGVKEDQDFDVVASVSSNAEDNFEATVEQEEERHQQRLERWDEEKIRRLENEQEIQDARETGWQDYVQAVSSGISNISGLFSAMADRRIQDLKEEKEQRLENINAELAQENLSEQQRKQLIKERQQIEQRYQKKIEEEKAKQFKLDKAANIARATMQTALGVAEALPNIPLSIAVGALGAAEIATVASQPNPYAEGGWIGGRRHRDGGTIIEAEKDEFITNRRSASEASRTLDYINRGPAAARQVESMFDDWATGSMPKAQQGGFVGSPPPRRRRQQSGSGNLDYATFARVIRQELESANIVAVMQDSIEDLNDRLNDIEEYQNRIGN